MQTKPGPFYLMDPEKSLRLFVEGSSATVPPWWQETDEDAACRLVAAQLGTTLPNQLPLLVDMLWDRTGRGGA
jgi:hypothetical protein